MVGFGGTPTAWQPQFFGGVLGGDRAVFERRAKVIVSVLTQIEIVGPFLGSLFGINFQREIKILSRVAVAPSTNCT